MANFFVLLSSHQEKHCPCGTEERDSLGIKPEGQWRGKLHKCQGWGKGMLWGRAAL